MASSEQAYTIGIVARRTKVHPETLRIWERRYALVVPQRNDTGRRVYSEADIAKLSLVKQLTELGHPVGGLASLSVDLLRERLVAAQPATLRDGPSRHACRMIVEGDSLAVKLRREKHLLDEIDIVAHIAPAAETPPNAAALHAEIILFELTTLNESSLTAVRKRLLECRVSAAVIVFSFATRSAAAQLEHAGIPCLKAPVTAMEIWRACQSVCRDPSPTAPTLVKSPQPSPPAPARRFDNAQLLSISQIGGTIACECPSHLAELVTSLVAFEQYSGECENRHAEDAALHAHLNKATGQARALLEDCLARIIESEGIHI